MTVPLLAEALSAREAKEKENKFNATRVWLKDALSRAENADDRYLLACLDAKGAGLPKADYESAGQHLLKLPTDYHDEAQPFFLHAEDLTRICEANTEAAIFILTSKTFSERIIPDYLARIAESHDTLAEHILKNEKLSNHLDAFDIARMGAASLPVANLILSTPALHQKLNAWSFAWLGESRLETAHVIFENEKFSCHLDALGIYRIGVRYKPIGKLILQNENFVNRISSDQLQRLKASIEK